ncbi:MULTISPECIES: hypothetical protein [unclassified Nocardioides]|uniref:hypothetical protein n=1 Tax=unclassified Nocardioides TaxID=2615069 RepID=UPI000702E730|nr:MULTISPECIES: hypothetical protein [unclassified Nocardioides]KRC53820.1 hypothetical protein ASE19_06945 [Nocardioides sp. Root79]KRC71155.1 hypothetical protein ASE20_09355 [Nocardioides sp. Root240]
MQQLRQSNKRLDAEECGELVSRYKAGGTVRGIAREFGVHHQTARRILDDVAAAVQMYESGVSIQQVAERFHQKYQSMRQELLRAGVVMRPSVAER